MTALSRALLVAACLAFAQPASAQLQLLCFPGTVSPTGVAPCTPCPEQTFAAGLGNTVCQPCPDGTYADEPGQAQCVRDVAQWPVDELPFPLPEPCDDEDDLERCIKGGIRDGGIVEIVVESPPEQVVAVAGKSFTLRPAAGVTPDFTGTTRISVSGGSDPVTVVIEGIELSIDGSIQAEKAGPGQFRFTLRDSSITGFGPTVHMTSFDGGTSPTEFTVENSAIAGRGVGAAIEVTSSEPSPPMEVRIRGNTIEQTDLPSQAAVHLNNFRTLTGEVTLNTIQGDALRGGVVLNQPESQSESTLRIVNNLIAGQTQQGFAGVSIRSRGITDVEILGNTIVDNQVGIEVSALEELADVTASIANNLVAFNATGITIGDGVAATNEFNLVHGNGANLFVPGPGTVTGDPLLLADGSLGEGSPARDAGSNAHVPADLASDLLGAPRITGPKVDIGAFELPEPPGALGGWAALLALAARRSGRERPTRPRRPSARAAS